MKILDSINKDRQLLSLVVIVLGVAFGAFNVVAAREDARPSAFGKEQIVSEIAAMKRDIANMKDMKSLDSVDTYWMSLFDFADRAGLSLKPLSTSDDNVYRGPLQSKEGVLSGSTDLLLASLYELQKVLPIYLYTIRIEGRNAEVSLSVVGV